jgi:hypothetical protein
LLGVFDVRMASPSAHFLHLKICTVFTSDLGLPARVVLRTIVLDILVGYFSLSILKYKIL